MELLILALFSGCIIGLTLTGRDMLYGLIFGFFLFSAYALRQKHTVREILAVSVQEIRKVSNILILFIFLGTLTAGWRNAATIPTIILYTSGLLYPGMMLLACFLLNGLMSVLTGTSFGTAATLGIIMMQMAESMGINPLLAGGAILSGVFVGDRCSPVSTSALLVAQVTSSDLYDNIRHMLRSAVIPFLLTCLVYLLIGLLTPVSGGLRQDLYQLFSAHYVITWLNLLPAVLIIVFALCRVNIRITIISSALCSIVLSLLIQQADPAALALSLITGYRTADPEIAAFFNGGGIFSMLRVMAIVSLTSTYAGIFRITGLLSSLTDRISRLAGRAGRFTGVLAAAAISSVISCNQTLATLLTQQLCESFEPDASRFGLDLEDSVIVMAPLVPWSIAGGVPIAVIGAPLACIPAACYLYLIPLCSLIREQVRRPSPAQ